MDKFGGNKIPSMRFSQYVMQEALATTQSSIRNITAIMILVEEGNNETITVQASSRPQSDLKSQ